MKISRKGTAFFSYQFVLFWSFHRLLNQTVNCTLFECFRLILAAFPHDDKAAKNATSCTGSKLQLPTPPNTNVLTFVYQTSIPTQLRFTC